MQTVAPIGLASLSNGLARLTWTGTPGKAVAVFIDGLSALSEPLTLDTTEKSVELPLDTQVLHTVSIVEYDVGEIPHAEFSQEDRAPLIHWTRVENAQLYTITIDDVQVGIEPALAETKYYSYQVQEDLVGNAWHHIAVTAVAATGETSEAAAFELYVHGYYPRPSDVSLTGSAGEFTLTLTP